MQILVADDSKTNLAVIKIALLKLGHEVIAATSGEEAIEFFQRQRPDLIILDVMMEGIDGFECARRIRAISSDYWIPIIFLSANVDDTSIAKGIDAGGDDYLFKPFSEVTLAAKIKAMERISDMRQRLFETTQKLYLISSTDVLTGIYNRLQFNRTMKEIILAAERYHYMIALLFIDLDDFKNANDNFGHHIGDLLLIEVARRLKNCIRANDFLARLGGDEFAIILGEINNVEEAGNIAQKIILSVSDDYNIENNNIRIGASIGIAFYPLSATNQEDLIINADIAMYHAKSSGRNNFQYFTEELNEKYRKQVSLESALKFALEKHELFLTYQPIFELKTKKLIGLEALLNWENPKFGLVSPSLFIAIAEETGVINDMGDWVLQTASEQARQWSLYKFNNFKLGINISSRQLIYENFIEQINKTIETSGMAPAQIEIELSETTVMSYSGRAYKEAIHKLHNMGISIAIDDFGTGYSSLTRLKQLPITTLKIEKSFIQDIPANANSAIIVNCLVALGKNLGLNVIAEGIETNEQLSFLIKNGCQQGQGFLLSRPLNTKQATSFLENTMSKQSTFL